MTAETQNAAETQNYTKPPKKVRPRSTEERNGVSRPDPSSRTGLVWVLCDKMMNEHGKVDRGTLIQEAVNSGLSPSTAATQYSRWRKFMGISEPSNRGRKKMEAPAAEEAVVQ